MSQTRPQRRSSDRFPDPEAPLAESAVGAALERSSGMITRPAGDGGALVSAAHLLMLERRKTDQRDARTLSAVSCRIDLPSAHKLRMTWCRTSLQYGSVLDWQ